MTCDDFVGGFWGEKIVKSKQNLTNIAYLEPCQTSNMKRFVKIVHAVNYFLKTPPLDVLQGSEYASESECKWFKLSCIRNKKNRLNSCII